MTIRIKRRSSYYVSVMIIPAYIICSLCIFGLFMPTDSTGVRIEKVSSFSLSDTLMSADPAKPLCEVSHA